MNKKGIILFATYLGLFANAVVYTIIIPFGSKMVSAFGMANDRDSTGTWVGILTFVLMFGRTIASPFWGIICDKWGRKPVMIVGTLSNVILSIAFGFSSSFIWALLVRFFLGIMTPLTMVVKTLLSELCPGESNAIAWQIVMWQMGLIGGNIIGGLLEDPKSSGLIKSGIFADYPFLLPNFFAAIMSAVALVLLIPFLEETLQKNNDDELSLSQGRSYWKIVTDPLVKRLVSVYFILSGNLTAFQELISLWCWASISKGGFEMNPSEIGMILAISSAILLLFQKCSYNWLVERSGLVSICSYSLLFSSPFLMIMPIASVFNEYLWLKWISLTCVCMAWYFITFISNTSIMTISNNSVISKERGRMNGIFMSMGSLARSVSPLFFGFLFAKSIEIDWIFPFDYALSFYLMAIFSSIGWIICKQLPKTLNYPLETVNSDKAYTELARLNEN
ncbi:unnamed protein product [Blepharisma stoltei]|uniref:Major facilitator superfamily (MFS) profile domain-containing protein n=1 Tax=Blepharisma stoltei TaxID=1481888 RepID=A0AAU9K6B6_9CILI|nr:unnamed protein product [Blepharisma stoltei]